MTQDVTHGDGQEVARDRAGDALSHHDHSADAAVAAMATVPTATGVTDSRLAPGFRRKNHESLWLLRHRAAVAAAASESLLRLTAGAGQLTLLTR